MTEQLRAELAAYLEKYYIPPVEEYIEASVKHGDEEDFGFDLARDDVFYGNSIPFPKEEFNRPCASSMAAPKKEEKPAKHRRPRLPSIFKEKQSLSSDQAKNLNHLMDELGESFHEKLFELIDASGMTDADVYKRANLDRKLFSKIRSNPAYHPRKTTVLALAIALRLDIQDASDLLIRAEYAFSPGSKSDLIVKFFIEHKVYDIDAINYTLEEYQQPILN